VTPFAELLERLVLAPSRNTKLTLLADFFSRQPDPDRGIALAAMTGELRLSAAKPALIRELVASRTDAALFGWSYDFVGDLAETAALLWPGPSVSDAQAPGLAQILAELESTPRTRLPALVASWLDQFDPSARFALLKLITGGLRVGVSARLAKLGLAQWSGQPIEAIEEVWHGIEPPYLALFAWLEGKAARPEPGDVPVFRSPMLATPLEEEELDALDPGTYRAEWKWDGIRVQLVATSAGRRVWSRTGDDVGPAFPEVVEALGFEGVLDGELLVAPNGVVGTFAALQQRLNRKAPTQALLRTHPAIVRVYDLLFEGREDLRGLAFDERRRRLEQFVKRLPPGRIDLSPLIAFGTWDELRVLRRDARSQSIEGLMLKAASSPYLAGRPKGPWFKWKRAPLTIDAVLLYAQRGHGKRSSFYSDFTFGVWKPDGELVPVGKAYFGFTDRELAWLDRWVRDHTVQRFGPVREVEKSLVLEIAFDGVQRSGRHRSGVALRFPRVSRIRVDKPAVDADRLEVLVRWLDGRVVAGAEP